MVSMALLKDRVVTRTAAARRSVRRGDVLAWSIAAAAVFLTATSMTLGSGSGALALVVPGGPIVAEPEYHAAPPEPAAAALLDPAKFRRPAPPDDGQPRVAIILRGLGLSRSLTNAAIKLPPDMTLGLSAYAREAQKTADAARAAGHEVFLDVPVEPTGFPANDPGPQALLSTLAANENARRLDWSLARFAGYPGVILADGSPVLTSKETLSPLLKSPALHGLVWAHGEAAGFADAPIVSAAIELTITAEQEPRALDDALSHLEALARQDGSALAVIEPSPIVIERLAAWATGLDHKGIVLVPASALAVDPPAPVAEAAAEPGDTHATPHGAPAPEPPDDPHDATSHDVTSHGAADAHDEPAHEPAGDSHAAPADDHTSDHASETPPSGVSGGHDTHH